MLAEYLNAEKEVNTRACRVGRVIQSAHYIMGQVPFIAVVPKLEDIQSEYVLISVGKDSEGTVHVAFPIGLFETAGDSDVLVWINAQNASFEAAKDQENVKVAEEKRKGEIELMRDLMRTYPEEVHGAVQTV